MFTARQEKKRHAMPSSAENITKGSFSNCLQEDHQRVRFVLGKEGPARW
jgi:hypothetical protein